MFFLLLVRCNKCTSSFMIRDMVGYDIYNFFAIWLVDWSFLRNKFITSSRFSGKNYKTKLIKMPLLCTNTYSIWKKVETVNMNNPVHTHIRYIRKKCLHKANVWSICCWAFIIFPHLYWFVFYYIYSMSGTFICVCLRHRCDRTNKVKRMMMGNDIRKYDILMRIPNKMLYFMMECVRRVLENRVNICWQKKCCYFFIFRFTTTMYEYKFDVQQKCVFSCKKRDPDFNFSRSIICYRMRG